MRREAHEIPTEELTAFFQEWLFFGLVIEALDGNSEINHPSDLLATQQAAAQRLHTDKQSIITRVYKKFVYHVDSESYITTTSLLAELQNSWPISSGSFDPTKDDPMSKSLADRNERIRLCLRQAYYFYTHLPPGFRLDVKFAIGAIAETIAHFVHSVRRKLNVDEFCPTRWGDGYYLNEEVRLRMLKGGWCESDLVRTVNKFKFLHTLHYLSFLDKKKPAKNQSSYEDSKYSANVTHGSQSHWKDRCTCREVEIDHRDIKDVLKTSNAVPLLVLKETGQEIKSTKRDAEAIREEVNLSIEVMGSTDSMSYVAISHVWSDGLGNTERKNSLRACKLHELRRIVQSLPPSAITTDSATINSVLAEREEKCPLIWLDTLCVPVGPKEDKKLALKKMRQVYEQACSVLVLDASMRSYSTAFMDELEALARIFTSKWLTRVWTLQEGALAKQLWFQFADKARSLAELKATMEKSSPKNLPQNIIFSDIRYEIDRIEQFFQTQGYDSTGSNLKTLDEALLHRAITNSSDEPVCIGALMDLPAEVILRPGDDIFARLDALEQNKEIEKTERDQLRGQLQDQLRDARMKVVWKLLAQKFQSLPAQIIFFEEMRLDAQGFRWAPQSLLHDQQVLHSPAIRELEWKNKKHGVLTDKGLKVSYPGFRLHLAQHNDGKPRHPWRGFSRIPETGIIFRDPSNKEWYTVSTKALAKKIKDDLTITSSQGFPLHDFIHQNSNSSGNSTEIFLLMSTINQGKTPHFQKDAMEGILTTGTFEDKASIPRTILAKSQHQVIVNIAHAHLSALYNVAEKLAMALRAKESTDRLLGLRDRRPDDVEYKTAFEAVKDEMKTMMADALKRDENLKTAIKKLWDDEEMDEHVWVYIADWFNHAFLGTKLGEDQVWIVDEKMS